MLAHVQTAGRGSRGRSWFDAPGNLALSVLLRTPDVAATVWPFAAACAVHETLSLHGAAGLRLKWPNDVLDASGGKVAGILVETGTSASGGYVVIGIGANLAAAPEIGRAASLGIERGVDAVAETLLARLAYWAEIAEDAGLAPVRVAWLSLAHPVGTRLAVAGRDGAALEGLFAGLDVDGALLLRTQDGVMRIATGDVLELA